MSTLDKARLHPLAAKPITLRFLINEFERSAMLPRTMVESYRRGCQILCQEQSATRAHNGFDQYTDVDERIKLAGKLAAATVLGHRTSIYIGRLDDGTAGPDAVLAQDIIEASDDRASTANALRQLFVSSGLFNDRGPRHVGWSHQALAEFLAASYLIDCGMTNDELLAELCTEQGVVPSLRETAAWAAAIDTSGDLFDLLLKTDPGALLQSELGIHSDEQRYATVKAVLDGIESGELPAHLLNYSQFDSLKHPLLGQQLRPYLDDNKLPISVRQKAIQFAHRCGVTDLSPRLAEIALEDQEDVKIRCDAAEAIAAIGDEDEIATLKLLVKTDTETTLLGHALLATWPKHVSTFEVFACLTASRGERRYDQYSQFIKLLGDSLSVEILPEALTWSAALPAHHQLEHSVADLLQSVLEAGWNNCLEPAVAVPFAKAVAARVQRHEAVLGTANAAGSSPLATDNLRRRRLVATMVELGYASSERIRYPAHGLLLPIDVEWLVGRADERGTLQSSWLALLIQAAQWYWTVPEAANCLAGAVGNHDALCKAMGWSKPWVGLGSIESRRMRREHSTQQKRLRKYAKYDKTSAPRRRARDKFRRAPRRVEAEIARFEAGHSSAGWKLHLAMLVDPANGTYEFESNADLTSLPGWIGASESQRIRIVRIAREYLLQFNDHSKAWIGTDTIYRPAWAGYRYLVLLYKLDRGWLTTRTTQFWRNWARTTLAFPVQGDQEYDQALLAMALSAQQEMVLGALESLLRYDATSHDQPSTLQRMSSVWNESAGARVLNLIRRSPFSPKFMQATLSYLMRHKTRGAVVYALSQVSTSGSIDREAAAPASAAALYPVMRFAPNEAWASWCMMAEALPREANDILMCVVEDIDFWRQRAGDEDVWSSSLPEEAIVRLLIWVEQYFPAREDPVHKSAHVVSARDKIVYFKQALLSDLVSRGSPAALDSVFYLTKAIPSANWSVPLLVAKRAVSQKSWRPHSTHSILLLANRSRRAPSHSRHETTLGVERSCRPEPMSTTPSSVQTMSGAIQRTVLFIGTEWSSGHGGLSTFNRQLAVAWAHKRPNDRVYCGITEPVTLADRADAARNRVTVVAPQSKQSSDEPPFVLPGGRAPDLVIGHGQHTGRHARLQCYASRTKRVHVVHVASDEVEVLKGVVDGKGPSARASRRTDGDVELAASADAAFAVGPRLARIVGTDVHGHRKQLREINPGLQLQESSGPPPDLRCLLLGRIEDYVVKGVDIAARAFARLDRQRLRTVPRLIARGAPEDRLERIEARLALDSGRNAPEVSLREFTSDPAIVLKEIRGTTVLLAPSRAEGFGLVALEAIAVGVPVLISSKSGLAELIEREAPDFVHDHVVDVGDGLDADADAWAAAMQKVLENPEAAFARVAQLGSVLSRVMTWDRAIGAILAGVMYVE